MSDTYDVDLRLNEYATDEFTRTIARNNYYNNPFGAWPKPSLYLNLAYLLPKIILKMT